MLKRYIVSINGIVQGVGFRPFIYKTAVSLNLKGQVYNDGTKVLVDIEGLESNLKTFFNILNSNPPTLSDIKSITKKSCPIYGYEKFTIEISKVNNSKSTFISPDISVCDDCINDIQDKNNRRYLYPFTNCINCGPRFTIIKDFPYDRKNTTMDIFQMCRDCLIEYESQSNRRYHAQPISCKTCGPAYTVYDNNSNEINTDNKILYIINKIISGKIVAIKGIGGFHLVCNGKNEDSIKRLRSRKYREDKPFAVMARNLDTAKKYCKINPFEEKVLTSNKKPIVLTMRGSF